MNCYTYVCSIDARQFKKALGVFVFGEIYDVGYILLANDDDSD